MMINKNIFLFLYNLFLHIFINKDKSSSKSSSKINKLLTNSIDRINNNIIINKYKYIDIEYSKENFDNIILFVESQNKIFAGEILEGILILVFSLAFYSDRDNTLGKYIFSNLNNIKEPTNFDLAKMFKEEKFIPKELKSIKNLLLKDQSFNIVSKLKFEKDEVLLYLLHKIFILKYKHINSKKSSKVMLYINKGKNDNEKISNDIYDQLGNRGEKEEETILDKDISSNSIMNLASNIFYKGEYGRIRELDIKIIRSFFIQVFIYHQNKYSPLMDYSKDDKEKKDLAKIPFKYDLCGACVEGRFAYIVLAPLRMEPRISRIMCSQNNFRENGMYELGKILAFNKNIKCIELNVCLIRTNYIEYFNTIFGVFNDYSVEVLNLSFNYFKDNSEEFIAKLLSHFRGLKTLNLTANEFRRGISSFLVVLKNLYRKGKSKLENLLLNKCLLEEASYYELGELLKCKYCKLKKLYINSNNMPANINFLKKLKKNKNLTKIYLNKNEITNNDAYDLMKVINITNIRDLNLYKNKITSVNEFIRLLYLTKIIKGDEYDNDCIIADESYLTNLDLSNNELILKNYIHIKLMNNLIKETSLNCLEVSHVIYGVNPDKRKPQNDNIKYRKNVEELKKYLGDKKKLEYDIMKGIRINEVDRNRNKAMEKDEEMKKIKDDDISIILENEKAIFPVYLKKQAKNLANKYFPDSSKHSELYKNLRNKIEKYLVLKRAEKKLVELKELQKAQKLIII